MKPIAATRPPEEGLDAVTTRKVTILGSTGSIGVNTADVILHARQTYGADAFPVVALTAHGNVKKLIEQARALRPKLAVIGDASRFATATPQEDHQGDCVPNRHREESGSHHRDRSDPS